MLIIGEKLNSSIPSALDAMNAGEEAVAAIIDLQNAAGADYIDINTALMGERELEIMKMSARLVIERTSLGIMLDSPSAGVLAGAAEVCGGRKLILNSVTSDERIDEVAPLAAETGCGVVVLPIDSSDGIPPTADGRLALAERAIEKLTGAGVSEENIYIDAICETLATGDGNARCALDTIRLIKEKTGAKTVCGLSNVSFGLPKRAFINASFMSMAAFCGLDAAIADPCSKELRKAMRAAEAVAGRDEYCMEYIGFIRDEYDV